MNEEPKTDENGIVVPASIPATQIEIKELPQRHVKPSKKESNIEQMLMLVIDKGLPIETLQKLLDMRKELRAEAAEEAYTEALAAFQAECPVIDKGKGVEFSGKKQYSYATFDMIIRAVQGLLGKHGLSYSFKLEEVPTGIKATCILKHKMGHSETSEFVADMKGTNMMSNAQIAASKSTFAKRYAFCNVTGIVTGEEDDDAPKTKEEAKAENKATADQYLEIDQLTAQAGLTKDHVTKRTREIYKVSFTEISAVQATGIITMLKKKIEDNQSVQ